MWLNKSGQEVNTAGLLYIEERSEGYSRMVVGFGKYKESLGMKFFDIRKHGYADSLGNILIDPKFEDAGKFSEGMAYVKQNGKYGYIDKTGKMIIEAKYKIAGNFKEGKAFVADEKDNISFIDKSGNIIGKVSDKISLGSSIMNYPFESGRYIEERTENKFCFSEGLINIKGKYYDQTGKLVLSTLYDSFDCKDGMIRFYQSIKDAKGNYNRKYGYYNKSGIMIIKPVYNDAEDFKGGKAKVGYQGSKGTWNYFNIDRTGKMIK